MTTDGTEKLQELRPTKEEIKRQCLADNPPDWIAWTTSGYKQMIVNAIDRKMERPDRLTKEHPEQACLALDITQLL